jgi:arabinose-5-phosphate isomerase
MLALGDALALVTSRRREFSREDFARFHPAGNLGRQLSKVDDFMRALDDCRLASAQQCVREVFVDHSRAGRRTGAIMLVDAAGVLVGLFTDSDLARLFESKRDAALDRPICEVMTVRPRTAPACSMMLDAVSIMAERKISELPIVDSLGRPCGLIDITDVVGLFPEARRALAPGEPVLARFPAAMAAPSSTPARECA